MMSRDILAGDYGYTYAPQAAENERRAAEASRAAPSAAPVVNIINESSQPVGAEVQMRGGEMDIRLFDQMVESSIQKSGRTGGLAKALGATPPKKRR